MLLPLVGVTASLTVGQSPERAYVNSAYLRAVQQAGGVPVVLPPQLGESALAALWPRLGALLLTGGSDIAPARFGEAPHSKTYDVVPSRDALEIGVTLRALDESVPVLGVCRGIQVLNVALGGSLVQDIADLLGSPIAHSQKESRGQPTHPVKVLAEGTRLGAIVDAPELAVNSLHHQAIGRLGRGLRAVAWAPDGVVEGVELEDGRRFVVGVQWHPEELVDRDPAARALFTALVAAARARSR